MDTKGEILRILTRTPISGAGLAKRLGISRQAVHTHLKELVLLGQVIKIGTTRAAVYELASHLSRKPVTIFFSKKLTLAKLAEDEVFRVYRNAHPGVEFRVVNLSAALQPMIRHVLDNYEI